MQFLTNSTIDFMRYRKVFVVVSVALLLLGVVELLFLTGINYGIDFAGGTQLTIRLRDQPDLDYLRNALGEAGQRDAVIQQFGPIEDREVLIKTPVVEGSEEGAGTALISALEGALNTGETKFDLNQSGTEGLASMLAQSDPDGLGATAQPGELSRSYRDIASRVIAQRESIKIFDAWEQVRSTSDISDAVFATLEENATLGAFHVLQNENVGPQIGSELRQKGMIAVLMSLLGMLAYIGYRFELRFGIGALIAVFHDFLITLGLFALFNYEFNLSTIAAFLTLVGYSVNDTVVIFDRVRENMKRFRRDSFVDVINKSINQTLSRTILTSGTTLLVVGCLFFLGGEVIRGFAFVLLIGVIIGTYSSIFVASPFTLLWEQHFGTERRTAKAKASSAKKPARGAA